MLDTVGCFDKGTGSYLMGYLPPCLSIEKHADVYTCVRPPTRLPLYTCASVNRTAVLCPFLFLFLYPWLPTQLDTNRCLE